MAETSVFGLWDIEGKGLGRRGAAATKETRLAGLG
jgi:hypothetical protein